MKKEISEIDEIIDETIKSLKGKDIEKKIIGFFLQLRVRVNEEEIGYGDEVLKAIIKARIVDKCSECYGMGFKNLGNKNKCSICNGKGYITAVEIEDRR